MNYTKTNPKGIDKVILKIQNRLYDKLGFEGLDGYGRIYPIIRDGKKIPAHYLTGTDYKDVFFNDSESTTGNFFFYEGEISKTKNSALIESTLNIVFQLDPNKIFIDIAQRNDEHIRAAIQKELSHTDLELEEITRGLKSLENFDHDLRDRKLLFLRFTGKIRYQLNC